mgnify:CR=1 FL=1
MIKNTLDLLSMGEFYGVSKDVDIAKGLYEIPYTWKSGFNIIKRMLWQKKSKLK